MTQKCKITSGGLTGRQRIAAEHYVQHGNKSEAYRAAYSTSRMKPETIHRNAHALFECPAVAAYVKSLQDAAKDAAILDRQECLFILSDIARGKVSEFIHEDGSIDTAAVSRSGYSLESFRWAVTEGGTTESIKVRCPMTAIDRLAKLEGWYKDTSSDFEKVTYNIIIDGREAPSSKSIN